MDRLVAVAVVTPAMILAIVEEHHATIGAVAACGDIHSRGLVGIVITRLVVMGSGIDGGTGCDGSGGHQGGAATSNAVDAVVDGSTCQ